MKLQVAKRDLEAALQVVSNSLNTSGSDLTSHIVFRSQGEGVEVLTFTGRLFSSAPVKCVADVQKVKSFTVEGSRLLQWIGAVGDTALDLWFDPEKKVVTAKAPKGSMEFQSLDPSNFPYWDAIWPDVVEKGKVKADQLAAALSYGRQFVFDKETKKPELCVLECRDGLLWATDQKAVTLVEVPGIGESTLRIHRNDAGAVMKFLGVCGDQEVTLLEHDRQTGSGHLLFKRADGAVFGQTRFQAKFPTLSVDRDTPSPLWWKVAKSEILGGIPFLTSGAAKEDNGLFFNRPDPSGPVRMGMKAMTGAQMDIDIPVIECDAQDGVSLPPGGFTLDYKDIQKVLGSWEQEAVTFGIHIHGNNGYVRFREVRDGVDFTTVCAWLRRSGS